MPGLGTGRVHISIFPFLKIEQFVQHTSHKSQWLFTMLMRFNCKITLVYYYLGVYMLLVV